MGPRARELLRNLATGIFWCAIFGATAGIAVTYPTGTSLWYGALRGILTGLFAGTTIGGFELLFDRGTLMWRVRRLPVWCIVVLRVVLYSVCLVACVLVGRAATQHIFEQEIGFLAINADFWATLIVSSGFAVLLLIAYKVTPLIGSRTLWRTLVGLYMKPRREERTILFMDLIGSTALTEQIGDAGFMRFFNDALFEMTHAIFRNGGRIYRYVGDEIIMTWPAKEAHRAVQCVFEIQDALREHRPYFEHRYGRSPRFRYGLHIGSVMVGELGDLRVEIAMLGDAINTAKRIEDSCRQFDFNIMASSDYVDRIELPEKFHAVPVDAISLRGKAEKLRLYGLVHSTHRLVSNPRIVLTDYSDISHDSMY
jgi:adenylate cyclase